MITESGILERHVESEIDYGKEVTIKTKASSNHAHPTKLNTWWTWSHDMLVLAQLVQVKHVGSRSDGRCSWTPEVRRILLTRPAVEAGGELGFLPGDLSQKVDHILRPLYDALFEMLGFEHVFEKLIERNVIEVAPTIRKLHAWSYTEWCIYHSRWN